MPRTPRQRLAPEYRLTLVSAGAAAYVVLIASLVFNLYANGTYLGELAVATFGTVFAVLAMIDAHRAFRKAKDVEEAVGSFRINFRHVLEEMILIASKAEVRLSLLIPTPAYGYLFNEEGLSERFVAVMEEFLGRPGTSLNLCLVFGNTEEQKTSPKNLLPQRYLKRAAELSTNGSSRLTEGYVSLVRRVFRLLKIYPERTELHMLRTDPNIRLIIADEENADNRVCLLSFAQSDPGSLNRGFQSTGFRSVRGEMVRAVMDLLMVYLLEQENKDHGLPLDDISNYYTLRF